TLVPAIGRGDEWPQFRGPGGTGLTGEKQLPMEWGADKNLSWKATIPGRGWSSPVIWGDMVFLTAAFSEKEPVARAGGGGGPGRGGFGGPPQRGQILPSFLQEHLSVTADQQKQFEELQKEVDGKLTKVLNDAQRKQLREPPGGGGRGGPGGFGGF